MRSSPLHEKPATLRIATRKSTLALAQTESVVAALRAVHALEIEIVSITTKGDALRDRSLTAIGGDGVFVKELMAALRDGRADIAVHSLKDLPTEIPAAARRCTRRAAVRAQSIPAYRRTASGCDRRHKLAAAGCTIAAAPSRSRHRAAEGQRRQPGWQSVGGGVSRRSACARRDAAH